MTAVKYVVHAMDRACLVQVHVPIARAALSPDHGARLDRACEEARTRLEAERDAVAAEIAAGGVCPWCNDLLHAPGQGCG